MKIYEGRLVLFLSDIDWKALSTMCLLTQWFEFPLYAGNSMHEANKTARETKQNK